MPPGSGVATVIITTNLELRSDPQDFLRLAQLSSINSCQDGQKSNLIFDFTARD